MMMRAQTADPLQFAVLIGTDAMRLCMGKAPRNFTRQEVIRWLQIMERSSDVLREQAAGEQP